MTAQQNERKNEMKKKIFKILYGILRVCAIPMIWMDEFLDYCDDRKVEAKKNG